MSFMLIQSLSLIIFSSGYKTFLVVPISSSLKKKLAPFCLSKVGEMVQSRSYIVVRVFFGLIAVSN